MVWVTHLVILKKLFVHSFVYIYFSLRLPLINILLKLSDKSPAFCSNTSLRSLSSRITSHNLLQTREKQGNKLLRITKPDSCDAADRQCGNLPYCRNLSNLPCHIAENCQKCRKLSRLPKTVKFAENCQDCRSALLTRQTLGASVNGCHK